MASLLENLIDVLDKENAEYEKLVVLAEEKTPTIIKGDVEGLSRITEDEQVIVGRIQGMEKQRIKVLADVANVVNRDVETLKLIDLIQMLEKMPEQQKKLKDIHERLKETTEKLRLLNDKNQLLLADKLDMVEHDKSYEVCAANSQLYKRRIHERRSAWYLSWWFRRKTITTKHEVRCHVFIWSIIYR